MKLAIGLFSKACGLVVGTLKKKEAQSSAESIQQEGKKRKKKKKAKQISRSHGGELYKTPVLLPLSVRVLSHWT